MSEERRSLLGGRSRQYGTSRYSEGDTLSYPEQDESFTNTGFSRALCHTPQVLGPLLVQPDLCALSHSLHARSPHRHAAQTGDRHWGHANRHWGHTNVLDIAQSYADGGIVAHTNARDLANNTLDLTDTDRHERESKRGGEGPTNGSGEGPTNGGHNEVGGGVSEDSTLSASSTPATVWAQIDTRRRLLLVFICIAGSLAALSMSII